MIDKKMEQFPLGDKEEVLLLQERVAEAQRIATIELKEYIGKKKRGRGEGDYNDGDDTGKDKLVGGSRGFGPGPGVNRKGRIGKKRK